MSAGIGCNTQVLVLVWNDPQIVIVMLPVTVSFCHDQEQKAHAGLVMFYSIVNTLLLLRDRAVHARARCMAVAHATRTHVGIILLVSDSASRSSSRHTQQVPILLRCQHSPILLRG
jgi:hypothetical protein